MVPTPSSRKASSADGQKTKKKVQTKSEKCGLTFPVSRINRKLKASGIKRVGGGAPVYLSAVAEYITAELMELAGNLVKDRKRKTITADDLSCSLRTDRDLSIIFAGFKMCTGDKFENITDTLALSSKPVKRVKNDA